MKLSSLFKQPQIVSLISESDTHVSLSLQDSQTAEAKRVDISADMATLPDEVLLSIQVSDAEDPRVHLSEWWAKGDINSDNGMFTEMDEADLPPTWIVTPGGQEFDLRAHAGGLF